MCRASACDSCHYVRYFCPRRQWSISASLTWFQNGTLFDSQFHYPEPLPGFYNLNTTDSLRAAAVAGGDPSYAFPSAVADVDCPAQVLALTFTPDGAVELLADDAFHARRLAAMLAAFPASTPVEVNPAREWNRS